ncbi:TonB family protein [Hymenobacter sp. J193]|uniref:energy transducer TonB n=1 Tax=Hymenobacter sp. J193 TaxID=2898429 RepID=UPI0021514742|nr:energy transducer TonB [Hymenobacter sp. J193]MCR5889427.1 TonB family protein [Hymenobacter sp. J193]
MSRALVFICHLLLTGLLVCPQVVAQTSARTYYTVNGRRTTFPDSAAYYTLVRKQGVGGTITTYQLSGRRLHQEQYSHLRAGQRHGMSTEWSATTGRRTSNCSFSRGQLQGMAQAWYQNGRRRWQVEYQQGKRHGALRAWYPSGRLMRVESYRAGVRTAAHCYARSGKDTTWFEFERSAQFAGGNEGLKNWCSRTLRYPALALRNQVEGIIWVQFVIDARGRTQNLRITKPLGSGTDEEVLRLLKIMPAWEPAVVAGLPTAVLYELPVEFRIR